MSDHVMLLLAHPAQRLEQYEAGERQALAHLPTQEGALC
jgi:hypothetical protein